MSDYGWSDDSSDYDRYEPSDYSSARSSYKPPRSTSKKASSRSTTMSGTRGSTEEPVGKTIRTDSTHPIIVRVDDTSSMASKPGVILKKLPVLGAEVAKISKDYAISFGLVSDRGDTIGLQIRDFDKGKKLDKELAALHPQSQGCGEHADYGLAAYFDLEHCEIPNAVKPIYILILDEPPWMKMTAGVIKKSTGDVINGPLDTKELFERLSEKFSVYVVTFDRCDPWEKWLGKQRVIQMGHTDVGDIVEILAGIVAGECGAYDDFEMRSSKRHADKPDRIARVSKALRSVADASKSAAASDGKAKSSKKKSGASGSKKKSGASGSKKKSGKSGLKSKKLL